MRSAFPIRATRLLAGTGLALITCTPADRAGAQAAPPASQNAAPQKPATSTSASSGPEIVVTARRLNEARDAIQPSLGASEFRLDRATLEKQPGGTDRSLTQVLLQAPGVTQDSFGQIHVRNEHANLQYRLDGIIVPESISGFGQTFDPKVADSIDLITGTLPAQYGYRTSGIVSLKTRSGSFDQGGDVSFYGGSHGTIEPSGSIHGSAGPINYFLSGSYLQNDLGVENPIPTRDAIHDETRQYRAFGYISDILSDTSRISLFGGTAIGHFQIPNNPDQVPAYTVNGQSTFDSAKLDLNQREITHYGVLAYQYAGGDLNFEVAPFIRYSQTKFTPDPNLGDIIFNGYADASELSSLAAGVQADGSYKLGDKHTLRFGLFFQNEHTRSDVTSQLLHVDDAGMQTSDVPFTIIDDGEKTGQLYGAYVQDEWKVTPTLTANFGLRYDIVRAYTDEEQASPRFNLVWIPRSGTTFHFGYARNFTPPPQELVGTTSLEKYAGTPKAPEILTGDPVRAEREHYFDGGVQQEFGGGVTLGLDAYYKIKRNLLDEGQFGESLVLSPFNYADGYAWGVELRGNYQHGPVSLYANLARGDEKGRNIVSSQFFFAPDELAYIANHYIYTDHSQRWTASGGASVTIRDGLGSLVPSADFLYGDGLRADDEVNDIPNGRKLPSYIVVNFGIAQKFDGPGVLKGLTVRLDLENAFDEVYLLRDGTGVGVGAPQYGARRGVFAGISKAF
jgi:outer membrane receptor protein involved in Fe transport